MQRLYRLKMQACKHKRETSKKKVASLHANYLKTIYLNKAKGRGKHTNKDLGTQNIPRYKQQFAYARR